MKPAILLSIWLAATSCLAAEPLSSESLDEIRATTTPCEQVSEKGVCLDAEQLRELTEHSFKEALETSPGTDTSPPPSVPPPTEPAITPQQLQIIEDFKGLPWGR